jgi:lauroyl/myristoyl acyltransferase
MTNKWDSTSAASEFKHRIFYFLIRFGGRYAAYFLLYFVVVFYVLAAKFRRRTYPYIEKRFPGCGFLKKLWHCYKMYLTFGKVLLDRSVLGITGKITFFPSAENDWEVCRRLHALGKGLIVITAHCGCWQSALSMFDFVEGERYVLYRRAAGDVDKQAHEHGKIKAAVKFIDPAGYAGGVVQIVSVLEKGGILCVMGDREFGSSKNSVAVPFLGEEIRVPVSIYRIAAAQGTPVVIAYIPFTGPGRLGSIIMDNFVVPDAGGVLANYTDCAARFVKTLEDFCQKYPYQYFNFYNIWG